MDMYFTDLDDGLLDPGVEHVPVRALAVRVLAHLRGDHRVQKTVLAWMREQLVGLRRSEALESKAHLDINSNTGYIRFEAF